MSKNSAIMKFGEMLTHAANIYTVGAAGPSFAWASPNDIVMLGKVPEDIGIGMEQTKTVFITVFLFAHGYASMIANNELKYDEDTINSHLERAYRGAILAAQEEMA